MSLTFGTLRCKLGFFKLVRVENFNILQFISFVIFKHQIKYIYCFFFYENINLIRIKIKKHLLKN